MLDCSTRVLILAGSLLLFHFANAQQGGSAMPSAAGAAGMPAAAPVCPLTPEDFAVADFALARAACGGWKHARQLVTASSYSNWALDPE